MAKLTTPDTTKVDDNPYTKLDVDAVKVELAKFQEALKSDANKDIDLAKELNIKIEGTNDSKPKEDVKDSKTEEIVENKKPEIDVEAQKKWVGIYENAKEALTDTGYKFDTVEPQTAKMSEAEKAIEERMDKISKAKFGEQKDEILKVDKDFPVEIVEKLEGIPIEDKVLIMSAMKEVASRNTEAVKKVQKELDEKAEIIKDAKFKAPEEAKEAKERVAAARAKFGLLTEEEVKAQKEAAYTNRKPT